MQILIMEKMWREMVNVYQLLVHCVQFFYKPETALRIKSIYFKQLDWWQFNLYIVKYIIE